MRSTLLVLSVPLLAFACAGATRDTGFEGDPAAAGTDGGASSSSSSSGSTGTVVIGDDSGTVKPSEAPAEVWGHSGTALYRLDPVTKAVTVVGDFKNCKGVVDIALNETSELFAVTSQALYSVDKTTATCTLIHDGEYPNSLSFVPKGTLDPAKEVLVGYNAGEYVRIDPATGSVTKVGDLGGGFKSSGDIVSVKGGPTYLTVTGASCTKEDCLVEVDPKTGKLIKNLGGLNRIDVFGLAFWGGSVYGFDNTGKLFEVKLGGGKLTVSDINIAQKPSDLAFWGAGSATNAPLSEPK